GGFFDLISIYTIFAGITSLLVFLFHGAIFINLKTEGAIRERALKAAAKLGIYSMAAGIVLIILTFLQTDLYDSIPALAASIIALILGALSWYLIKKENPGKAMISNGISIALVVGSLFLGLYPRVMVSSIKPEYSLTIHNASSSAYTLSLMTKVALVFVPIVLGYQIWTYWVFRKRVTSKDIEY
ncbi:MAG: cytochrome d ubiquinol oxidase subunit II, partial [Bacillota bacterium]|nr:cytochrome d ubiquinol oxidase subunit II [Bacillota bacterium]